LLGNAYHQLDKDADSEASVLKALTIREKIHDDFGMAESFGSLALISMRKSDWRNARVLLEKAIAIFEQIEDYRSINSMIYNLGVCDMELSDYKGAEAAFDRIINYSKENNIRDESLIRTLRRQAFLLKKQGRLEEAFKAQEHLLDLKDTLFSEERARSFEEMNVKYETQIKEEKLNSIQKENSQISEKRLYLMVGLILVLLLSAALVFVMAKRNHQARLLFEAENKLHQQQLDETQRELAFNRKQLEDFTLHLLEKNKVINELETRQAEPIQLPEIEKTEEREEEDFASLMQLKILTDEDWTKFKLYFDKAFPGMIFRLRHEFPALTGSEQRLFLLIKLKNDSREMSDLLGISMESVRKNKYRLKKKLQLEEDQSLEEFIQHYK
jgi:tetratricopeptide (TPR) repeat protein